MQIKETKNQDQLEIVLTSGEAMLVSDMIGNTISGAPLWTIAPDDFEKKIGISYDKAHELFVITRESGYKRKQSNILLTRKELEAVKIMTKRFIDLWDEGDFLTMIATEKSKATELIEQIDQGFPYAK